MNLIQKISKTPKRFIALSALLVAGVATAVTFAWGPSRPTYTIEKPADKVTFNSITNNPIDGDERNFARAVETSDPVGDIANVEAGKTYTIRMVAHNNAAANLNLKATGTRASVGIPSKSGTSLSVTNFVTADNATPKEVWDEVVFKSNKEFSLVYVPGSARIYNSGYAKGGNGQALPDSLVTSAGAKLGYEKAGDGIIPGCFQYLSYVEYKVRPQFAEIPDFSITKDVRKSGTTTYGQTASVNPGEKVDFRITFKNTGESTLKNVIIKDALPAGMTYVAGTAKLQNSNYVYPNMYSLNEKLFSEGSNIGTYTVGANAFVTFSATVNSNDKLAVCGLNSLRNVAKAETDFGNKEDDAVVTVDKKCEEKTIRVCRLSDKKYPHIIKESEFDKNKHSMDPNDCKEAPKDDKIKVCRLEDKQIVWISKDEFDKKRHSENFSDCENIPVVPETPETPETPGTPEEIPSTGPEALIGGIVGSGALSYGAYTYASSRRALKNMLK